MTRMHLDPPYGKHCPHAAANAATIACACALARATAAVADVHYDAHEVDAFHVHNGLITEFWFFSEDQEATDRISRAVVTSRAQR